MMFVPVKAVVCLSLWLSVYQVSGAYLTAEMNRTIQNLLQHYKISAKDRFDGNPVFSKEPLTGRTEMKRVFMGGVLETYEKLIGHMLKQLPTPSPQTEGSKDVVAAGITAAPGTASDGDTRAKLMYILKKVQGLRKNGYQEQEKLLQGLHALKHIKMDSPVVQSKALLELPWLYDEASSLTEHMRMERRRRRRRRQARRIKARPRV